MPIEKMSQYRWHWTILITMKRIEDNEIRRVYAIPNRTLHAAHNGKFHFSQDFCRHYMYHTGGTQPSSHLPKTKFYPAMLLYMVLNQNHKNILCTCSGRKLHHTYNSFQTRTMVFMLSSHHPWFQVVLLYCLLYTPPILVWDYSWTTLFSEWKYQVAGCVPVHGRLSSSKLRSFWLRFSCT